MKNKKLTVGSRLKGTNAWKQTEAFLNCTLNNDGTIKKSKYTFDFVNVHKFKNKLIEVEADNLEEAKEKILLLLTKINDKIIKVRTVKESDYD